MPAPAIGTSLAPPGRSGAGGGAGGAPGGARRFTREDVLRLGQGGGAWAFAPVAVAALRASPGDAAVRFLFAAALGRLGLRTLALEQLGLVTGEGARDPAVGQLRGALDELPGDELMGAERARLVRANVDALGDRGADLRGAVEAWCAGVAGVQAYRTNDGNVVRRARGEMEPGAWVHLADHAGAARAFVAEHVASKKGQQSPVTLEGLDPPWLLGELARAMPRDASGFQARLVVVQGDVMEALDGLSLADLREALGEQRVLVFAGADAGVRLAGWGRANLEKRLTGAYVPLNSVRQRVTPGAQEAIAAVLREQERVSDGLRAVVLARDAARTPAHWAARFAPERVQREGLRVLIPTCRYTTFLRHAAGDLAAAFEGLGHRAEVLLEGDGQSQMSSVAYLEAIERVDPDLIVFINYTRLQFANLLPPGVPLVCWVQDMMPHLFRPESGAGQGPMDFIAGHCGEELFTRHGYARERAIGCPVVASERKFHGGEVEAGLRERFACEIACVTHHSESVAAMHERLLAEVSEDAHAAGVLEVLRRSCLDVAARAHVARPWAELRAAVSVAMRGRHPRAGDPGVEGIFFRGYAMPLADRAFRHLAIGWAARIAERRGWRLRLYGKGWEKHPEFARHAAGLTEHGEELRACYQMAGVHLHLCLSTLMHQRPMECVLSGGLPIMRATPDALSCVYKRAMRACEAAGVQPSMVDETWKLPLCTYADSAEGMRYASMLARLGMRGKFEGVLMHGQGLAQAARREALDPIETDPTWLYGDLPEVCFRDESEMEGLVERAIERPDWREAVSAGIAGRVRERLTHTALARRVVEAVGKRARELAGS